MKHRSPSLCAVVLARMNSSRYPGKSVATIGGIPMVEIIARRLKDWTTKNQVQLFFAVESLKVDEPIARVAQSNGIRVYDGRGNSPKFRVSEILKDNNFDYFYRINGDSPFVDVDLLEFGLNELEYLIEVGGNPDIVTNVAARTFPYGISLELCSSSSFLADLNLRKTIDDEDIFKHIYSNPNKYYIHSVELEGENLSAHRLVVDVESDRLNLERILEIQGKGVSAGDFDWKEMFGLSNRSYISRRGLK